MAKEQQRVRKRPNPDEILDLFTQCRAEEARITPDKWKKVQELFVREMAFGPPLFPRSLSALANPKDLAEKYASLLDRVRQAPNGDRTLWVLANWAKCEGIKTPEKLLPEDVFRRLTTDARKKFCKMPWTDFYYADLIRVWLPYSKALLQQIKNLRALKPDQQIRELRNLKFDADAISLAARKSWRSEVAFTCEWLAERTVVRPAKRRKDPDPARTLRNAYSRIHGSGAPRLISCAFCEKLAVSEFNAQDYTSAAHCEDHRPERLPTSTAEAWRDQRGRHWSRLDGKIRYLT